MQKPQAEQHITHKCQHTKMPPQQNNATAWEYKLCAFSTIGTKRARRTLKAFFHVFLWFSAQNKAPWWRLRWPGHSGHERDTGDPTAVGCLLNQKDNWRNRRRRIRRNDGYDGDGIRRRTNVCICICVYMCLCVFVWWSVWWCNLVFFLWRWICVCVLLVCICGGAFCCAFCYMFLLRHIWWRIFWWHIVGSTICFYVLFGGAFFFVVLMFFFFQKCIVWFWWKVVGFCWILFAFIQHFKQQLLPISTKIHQNEKNA